MKRSKYGRQRNEYGHDKAMNSNSDFKQYGDVKLYVFQRKSVISFITLSK